MMNKFLHIGLGDLFFRYLILVMGILLFASNISFSQLTGAHNVAITIPEIMILDIEPDNSILNLTFDTPSEGGAPIGFTGANNSKWINYTCALASGAALKNIYIQTLSGNLPEGVSLDVTVGNASGGSGTLGIAHGTVAIDSQPKLIISGIGRGYTGNGVGAGHQLTYELSISDYSKLDADYNGNIQIMITISE